MTLPPLTIKTLTLFFLSVPILALAAATAETPKGLTSFEWTSIRAAYEAGQHQFFLQEDGTHTAKNPGLGWRMTFDATGFTATDGNWTWGLEMEQGAGSTGVSPVSAPNTGGTPALLTFPRTSHLTEWFINDQRGLEQGWTLTAPADIRLRVRGTLKADVTPQAIRFGNQITYSGLKAWDATGKTVPTYFEPTAEGFAVRYDDTGAQYPLTIDPIAQNACLKASNTGAFDQFGWSVAVAGDTVVVGAPEEESSASGINGNQANNDALAAGAVYIFVRSGNTWSQQAYLKASNTAANDRFGHSVAVAGDTVVVGARGEASNAIGINGNQTNDSALVAGAAYVFVRSGGTWSQQAYLKASNTGEFDAFGFSVAVAGDTVVVGANGEDSNASGINGIQTNDSAADAGAAYVFVRSGSTWSQQAYLKASNTGESDAFGMSVAVAGDTVVVGANGEDSNASGINGNQANDSFNFAGAAYVFVRSGSAWSQQAYLKASNTGVLDQFGASVVVAGDTVVVGAKGESSNAIGINGNQFNDSAAISGAAYVFVRNGSTWSQQAYLKASNTGQFDQFGHSVALAGDTVVVGAPFESSNATGINGNQTNDNTSESGAAYVFVRSGSTWSQQAYLKASTTGVFDLFGSSVAVAGDTVVVGAYFEDSNASGINGNQANDLAEDSGAAYVFSIGEILNSLAKTGYSVPGTDLAFGVPAFGALSPSGEALFESSLLGAGSSGGRNKAVFTTVGGSSVDIALQTGSIVSGVSGLPLGAKIATLTSAVHNRSAPAGLFQATVTGSGINTGNNRLLFLDNGAFIAPLSRTGVPVAALGGAIPSAYSEVLQREGAGDQIALSYTLKAGTAGVNGTNESGLLLMNHAGAVTQFNAREGGTAFDGGGTFGQFGRATVASADYVSFVAKFIPTSGKPVDALFYTGAANGRATPLQGEAADGTSAGELYGVFTGLARVGIRGLLRATLTQSPVSSNEGVWDENGVFLLRKGAEVVSGLKVAKIIRVWGVNNIQSLYQVQLSGTGVTASNNQALILRQAADDFVILMRTGQPAPGIGLNKVTVGVIQAIDVDPINGHYAILGSLKGTASTANQALWSGRITVLTGDERLPKLRVQKGERYSTEATFGSLIRSISLKPAVDASGVGGRGLAQVINAEGQILLTLTGDLKVQETVRLTP